MGRAHRRLATSTCHVVEARKAALSSAWQMCKQQIASCKLRAAAQGSKPGLHGGHLQAALPLSHLTLKPGDAGFCLSLLQGHRLR